MKSELQLACRIYLFVVVVETQYFHRNRTRIFCEIYDGKRISLLILTRENRTTVANRFKHATVQDMHFERKWCITLYFKP